MPARHGGELIPVVFVEPRVRRAERVPDDHRALRIPEEHGAHGRAASSQSPAAGDSGDAPAETQGEEQSLAATLLFNGPSHADTAAPGAWGESGCDAQKQARIIVVRGTEEPVGQSLMSPLASRIAAELGDHAQVSDLDYPASWESGSEAARKPIHMPPTPRSAGTPLRRRLP